MQRRITDFTDVTVARQGTPDRESRRLSRLLAQLPVRRRCPRSILKQRTGRSRRCTRASRAVGGGGGGGIWRFRQMRGLLIWRFRQ